MIDPATGFDFIYAGMHAGVLAMWVVIATTAGHITLRILPGPVLLGLWGDMTIGLIGAFGLGWGLRQIDVDLSRLVLTVAPNTPTPIAIWIDVFIAAFVGALAIRALLRPFKRAT